MNNIIHQTIIDLAKYLDIVPIIFGDLAILYAALIVSKLIAFIVKKLLPKTLDPILRVFIPKASRVFAFVVSLMFFLKSIIGLETSSMMTLLGFSVVAMGVSLREIFVDMIHGIMILLYHKFQIGDEITLGDTKGKVLRIDLLTTIIDCGENTKALIPNSKIFTGVIKIKKGLT